MSVTIPKYERYVSIKYNYQPSKWSTINSNILEIKGQIPNYILALKMLVDHG